MNAVDIFAGPGGWDEGLLEFGIKPLGIEWDDAACETREAAGHRTLQADVAELDPADFAPCEILIASPPCQGFSAAGKRGGSRDAGLIMAAARALVAGRDERSELAQQCEDPRSMLVVEPLRWALTLQPRVILLEQVPEVLTFWRWIESVLPYAGRYRTWSGILNAADYGVPQTRKRAFMLASLESAPLPPPPSHTKDGPTLTMHDTILERWISMADALGWRSDEGTGSETTRGKGMRERHGPRRVKPAGEEAPTITSKTRSWLRVGNQAKATIRTIDEPAPTMLFGHALNDVSWGNGEPPVLNTGRDWKPGGTRADAQQIESTEPAPTLSAKAGGQWHLDRPATTVQGDPRIAQPGHKRDKANPNAPGRMEDAIKITVEEAAVLQGFRHNYPFQGSRTKQFEQVGNAVPPPLARAVAASLLSNLADAR